MRKIWVLIGLGISAVLVLSACGGGQRDVQTASQFLDALNQGDIEAARRLACPDHVRDVIDGLATVSDAEREEWVFENVNCQAYGGDVLCSYQITQELEDATRETFDYEVTFEMEDGLVCGFADPLQAGAP